MCFKKGAKMKKGNFFKLFLNMPNFALPAHKIILVLGNNNLYTETNK